MIRIDNRSGELTKIQEYLMTVAPSINVLKDVEDGTKIQVAGWLEFSDIKDDGEITSLFSIITPENNAYCCQSSTFHQYFMNIVEIMGDKPFGIIKKSGTTKSGRGFIYCELDLDSIK